MAPLDVPAINSFTPATCGVFGSFGDLLFGVVVLGDLARGDIDFLAIAGDFTPLSGDFLDDFGVFIGVSDFLEVDGDLTAGDDFADPAGDLATGDFTFLAGESDRTDFLLLDRGVVTVTSTTGVLTAAGVFTFFTGDIVERVDRGVLGDAFFALPIDDGVFTFLSGDADLRVVFGDSSVTSTASSTTLRVAGET